MHRRILLALFFSALSTTVAPAQQTPLSGRTATAKPGAVIAVPRRLSAPARSVNVRAAVSVKTPAQFAKGATPSASVIAEPSAAAAPALSWEPEPGGYTGVLIDTRHLPEISRSPAPALYSADGTANNGALLYPDRAHVPTPDEVQEFTVVRYYYDETEAKTRLVGAHPLLLRAVAVVGPAHDAVTLCPADALLLAQADKTAHFTRNWRVGFLLPLGK